MLSVKWAAKKPYYHQESDRVVYFGETKTDSLAAQFQGKVDDFRVISVCGKESEITAQVFP